MFRKVPVILCLVICLIFLSLFTWEFLDKKEGETFYRNVLPSTNIKDINKLENEYEGATGYIEIPDTSISYPIMQGKDNSYYLKHLPNGKSNKMGSIFLDYRNNGFNDKNTIIYGHNFNNGTMFSDLLNYKSSEFYKKHSNYKIYTSDKVIEVSIVAVYIADATKEELPINFESLDDFESYMNMALKNSLINSNESIGYDDSLITLCTCSNGSWKSRLIVIGKVLN